MSERLLCPIQISLKGDNKVTNSNDRSVALSGTETVTAYIAKCIDDVTHSKTITVRANWKP